MSELEKEEFEKRTSAFTYEECMIAVKHMPSEIILAELALRLSKKQGVIDWMKQAIEVDGGR